MPAIRFYETNGQKIGLDIIAGARDLVGGLPNPVDIRLPRILSGRRGGLQATIPIYGESGNTTPLSQSSPPMATLTSRRS